MLGVLGYITRVCLVILLLTNLVMGQQGPAPTPNTETAAPPAITQPVINNDQANQQKLEARRFPTRHLKPCIIAEILKVRLSPRNIACNDEGMSLFAEAPKPVLDQISELIKIWDVAPEEEQRVQLKAALILASTGENLGNAEAQKWVAVTGGIPKDFPYRSFYALSEENALTLEVKAGEKDPVKLVKGGQAVIGEPFIATPTPATYKLEIGEVAVAKNTEGQAGLELRNLRLQFNSKAPELDGPTFDGQLTRKSVTIKPDQQRLVILPERVNERQVIMVITARYLD